MIQKIEIMTVDVQKIKELYKTGFASSPVDISDKEIALLQSKDCSCEYCGTSIFDLYDFPNIRDENELICEYCYHKHYQEDCSICEETMDTPQTPNEHVFVITESAAKEMHNREPGIYQVKSYPFFYGNILSGFDGFFDDAIELIKPIRIEEVTKYEFSDNSEVSSGNICDCCFLKYTGQTRLKNNFVNRKFGINQIITLRGLIQKGGL